MARPLELTVKLSIAGEPEGDMQRRGGSGQSVKEQRTTTRPKTRKAPTTHVSGADFPAFIVIDDKGNDFFKDLNLG
jgi:hypothetical protein